MGQSSDFQELDTLVLNLNMCSYPTSTPNLRRLRVCHPSDPPFSTPWAQLTHLDVTAVIMFSEFLRVLSMCLSLVDGEFNISHKSISADALVSTPVPILPRLKRLVLHNVPLSGLDLLPSQSFEAVEELGLMNLRPSPEGFAHFAHHIHICDIAKRLTFSMWLFKFLLPTRLLKQFEFVTSLTLFCALNTKKMDAFLHALATTPLFPQLTNFELYLRVVNGFDLRLYKTCISDRWSTVNTKLTKCSLIFISRQAYERTLYNTLVMRLHELMKPLVDDGLIFSMGILDNFPSFAWSPF